MIFPQLHTTVYNFILFFSGVSVYLYSSSEADVIIVCCVSSQGCVENRGEFVGRACGHHGPYIPDVLFWSVILFFSTVAMSSFLKEFKTSRYFPTKARSLCVVQYRIVQTTVEVYVCGIMCVCLCRLSKRFWEWTRESAKICM